MNDETADIQTSATAGEASPQPDAGGAPVAAKKKRSKVSAKAATAAIEARIGHKFADPALLATAFTHVSALKSARKRGDSYQRLEFLGDAVLGLVVSRKWSCTIVEAFAAGAVAPDPANPRRVEYRPAPMGGSQ